MSISIRVFFFNHDNSIIKIPVSRYDRLFNNDPDESFPEYAGKRVRCAIAFVILKDRRPAKLTHIEYTIVSFGSDGRLDQEEFHREGALVMEALGFPDPSLPKNVVSLSPRIAQKRYHERFKWTPTEDEINSIIEMVWHGSR